MREDIIGAWKCVAHQEIYGETKMEFKPAKYTNYRFDEDGTAISLRKGLLGRPVTSTVTWEYLEERDAFTVSSGDILLGACTVQEDEMCMYMYTPVKGMAFYFQKA